NGKEEARAYARIPSMGTLRPCVEESSGKDGTPGKFDSENLYIEGDNLEVLKLLQGSYHKRVKMIYIDPPYNTGKDFVYPDNFRDSIANYKALTGQTDDEGKSTRANPETSGRYHTDWLNMMYPRLILARNLLTDDGVIFISIDGVEVCNLERLCNEVFGEENHIGTLIIQTATDNNETQINTEHEYMLCYAKDIASQPFWGRKSEAALKIQEEYKRIVARMGNNPPAIQEALRKWIKENKEQLPKVTHYDNVDYKGVFHDGDIANTKFGGYVYDVIHPVTGKCCKVPEKGFRFPPKTMEEMIANDDILFGEDETTLIKPKKRLESVKDSLRSVIYEDGRASTKVVESLLGRDVFKNPKSHFIISRLIEFCSNDKDIILDFFAGSSTTAHAMFLSDISQEVHRKFILVQLPEVISDKDKEAKQAFLFCKDNKLAPNICEIGKERIRRAAKKIKEETPLFAGDMGFKVFKLDTSNFIPWNPEPDKIELLLRDAVENILIDRTRQDLLYEVLLKCNLPLTLPIEEKKYGENTVYIVGEGALAICLDMKIPQTIAEEIVKLRDEYAPIVPMQVVFRDNGFTDVAKTNALQILKQAGFEEKSVQTI
ncbi:MAG: site-specific DNA-methyltransferase, partial [Acholeplasmataceae bacterium]|nr:site-specific DNA-methyltransferase [Acholeplasmataceae bacterium]